VPHDDLVSSAPNPLTAARATATAWRTPDRATLSIREYEIDRPGFRGSRNAAYRVTRFDPGPGSETPLDASARNGTTFVLRSPDTEDWVYEAQKN